MQVCEWLEKVLYGEKSFIEKCVWIGLNAGEKLGVCKFTIPYSNMLPYPDGKLYKKVMYSGQKSKPKELHIMYRMPLSLHNSATFKGKKPDGTPRFKSSRYKQEHGTTIVQETKSGFKNTGGLTKSNKQYYCKSCQGKVYVERDGENNAFCVDCGKKMFG